MARTLRIVFAGGGTGGHLFPALAVAREVGRLRPDASILFIGGRRGLEGRLVPAAGYPLRTLPLSGLKGRRLTARVGALAAAAAGGARCALWFLAHRPSLVVGVGGYASGPAVLAAWMLRVPTMLMEQNHYPGATNRFLAPRADVVCLPSEAARARLGGIGVVTGNPVRPEFAAIGSAPGGDRLALLAFGGSRGARSINRAMVAALPGFAAMIPPPRIVHQTGPDDHASTEAAYSAFPALDAQVLPFFDDMPRRLAEADLVVCRAGATALAELAAAGRPAILVPFPFAADDHQTMNAEAVRDAGAAVVLRDDALDGTTLVAAVRRLADDAPARVRMGAAARSLARPEAATRIAGIALDLVRAKGGADVP